MATRPTASVTTLESEISSDPNRTFTSYPLALNSAQASHLLDAILDFHWTYQGDYSFIDRNCVTEIFDLLRAGLPEFGLSTLTENFAGTSPRGFVAVLQQTGLLTNEGLSAANASAIPSAADRYNASFQNLKANLNPWPSTLRAPKSFEDVALPREVLNQLILSIQKRPIAATPMMIQSLRTLLEMRELSLEHQHHIQFALWMDRPQTGCAARSLARLKQIYNQLQPLNRLKDGYGLALTKSEIIPMDDLNVELAQTLQSFENSDLRDPATFRLQEALRDLKELTLHLEALAK